MITYTFPPDCPIHALRGRTFTGGQFCRADGKWQAGEPDAVRFAERCDGKAVVARIAGKPGLEAALAENQAAKRAITARLAAMGWPQYQAMLRAAGNARHAYDLASERSYPATEAATMRAADEALVSARAQYPLASAYAYALAYRNAANDQKSAAGTEAVRAIESGADPIAAVAHMKSTWSANAMRAVNNA